MVKRGQNDEVPYTVRSMGMYVVIETTSGLILMWNKKTSIFIKLSPSFKVRNQRLNNGNLQSRCGPGVNPVRPCQAPEQAVSLPFLSDIQGWFSFLRCLGKPGYHPPAVLGSEGSFQNPVSLTELELANGFFRLNSFFFC